MLFLKKDLYKLIFVSFFIFQMLYKLIYYEKFIRMFKVSDYLFSFQSDYQFHESFAFFHIFDQYFSFSLNNIYLWAFKFSKMINIILL